MPEEENNKQKNLFDGLLDNQSIKSASTDGQTGLDSDNTAEALLKTADQTEESTHSGVSADKFASLEAKFNNMFSGLQKTLPTMVAQLKADQEARAEQAKVNKVILQKLQGLEKDLDQSKNDEKLKALGQIGDNEPSPEEAFRSQMEVAMSSFDKQSGYSDKITEGVE